MPKPMIKNIDTVNIDIDEDFHVIEPSRDIPEISHGNSTQHCLQEENSKVITAATTDEESTCSEMGSFTSTKHSTKISSSPKTKAATTKKKSKFWKKPRDKPKRPLSAYNIFFKHTRTRIINGLEEEGSTPEEITRAAIEAIIANSTQPRVPRSNRKTHGRIGFGDLARKIANQWKALDSQQRAIYDHYASLDMERYRSEVSVWKAKKESQIISPPVTPTSSTTASSQSKSESRQDHEPPLLPEQSFERNSTNEWTALQDRGLDTSFSSDGSEETDSSFEQDFLAANPHDRTKAPFPSLFEISSHRNYNDSIDCGGRTPPSQFEISTCKAIQTSISTMRRLRLVEEIRNHRNEIDIREKQLSAINASMEKDYNSSSATTTKLSMLPSFPVGPSIERMQQLHLHRLCKGDPLPPLGMNRKSHRNSNSGSMVGIVQDALAISSHTTHTFDSHTDHEECMSIDPVPLNEIFSPSVFDIC